MANRLRHTRSYQNLRKPLWTHRLKRHTSETAISRLMNRKKLIKSRFIKKPIDHELSTFARFIQTLYFHKILIVNLLSIYISTK